MFATQFPRAAWNAFRIWLGFVETNGGACPKLTDADGDEKHSNSRDSEARSLAFHPLLNATSSLMPARQKRQTIAGSAAELKELLGRGFAVRLLLDHCGLKCLFALKIGQHQFAQLHELLNFLL